MKNWLCLTCQMQRALLAAESVEPPLMKPQASPNKVSTPLAAQKEISKDHPITTELQNKEENKPSVQMDVTKTPTTAALPAKETPDTVSSLTEKKTTAPTKEVPTSFAPIEEPTAVVSDLNKSLPAQLPPLNADTVTCSPKKKDIISQSSPSRIKLSEKKAEIVQKSADKPVTFSDDVQPPKAPNGESTPVEMSFAKSALPAAQATNQKTGLFSIGGPQSQHAESKTTEAMTGKIMGFGSSLFSSASTLITSANKEESRTTPPSSRKMSAPAQVSGKMATSQISPKSSSPVSPRMTSEKEAKLPPAQKPHPDIISDQSQEAKVPLSIQSQVKKDPLEPSKPEVSQGAPKVGQSSCPLCKAKLNVGSKELPNYNTCSECKTDVCNKCGFSPMPHLEKVIQFLQLLAFVVTRRFL